MTLDVGVDRPRAPRGSDVALLTGGGDRPYAVGLALALVANGLCLDFVGSDELDIAELRASPRLSFLNLRGNQRADASLARKSWRVLAYYARLIRYACAESPELFHILWNNKFEPFDRTVLMLYYRLLGKRIVLTVHNVNAGTRDGTDSWLNRLTLGIQYRLSHHLFVHTEKMKSEIHDDFGLGDGRITVIPFGLNDTLADTGVSPQEAKRRLGIAHTDKTVLFFGAIRPYKGLEYLVAAFRQLLVTDPNYRLIIAGQPNSESRAYLKAIEQSLSPDDVRARLILKTEYIPDDEAELYFKAADVLVLPYTHVFQSGVLFSGYRFGLPVVATDVGSLREDIIEGRTGYVCAPRDAADLATAVARYFRSDLFKTLSTRRRDIQAYARARHSWDVVGETTRGVYEALLGRSDERRCATAGGHDED